MEEHDFYEILKVADDYYQEKNYKRALTYYKKALNGVIPKGAEADLYLKLGNLYSNTGDYTTARGYYDRSLKGYRRSKDNLGQAYSLTGLGVIQGKLGDGDEARRYLGLALNKFRRTGDSERQGVVHSLIANTYETQSAWEDALLEFEQSKKKFEDAGRHVNEDYARVTREVGEKRSRFSITRGELAVSVVYLLALIAAELMVAFFSMEWGLVLEAVILFALLFNSSFKVSYNFSILLRSMMALPIVRIIGLSIPLMQIPPLYWFPIISIPLFAASFTIMRSQRLSLRNMGFIWGNVPLQLAVALTGVILGTIEFVILQPKPLIATFNLENLLLASIILIISTGLAEEILFRGIIQKNSMNVFGAFFGLLYTSLLFTALHIGWTSFYDIIFVFFVSLFYGYVFYKTKSIIGITLSHGISNTLLFLVVPFYTPLVFGLASSGFSSFIEFIHIFM